MSKPTTNWDTAESWKRLVAAMLAAGTKPDLTETARYYGTTRGAIEWQLRTIKKDAKALQAEVDGGAAPAAPTTPVRTKKTSKKDALHSVANGRVEKTLKKKTGVKVEDEGDEEQVEQEEINFD